MAEPQTTGRADSDLLPWVQDLDGLWHRRPAGRAWFTDREDGANAETCCGVWVASAHVSNFDPRRSVLDDEPARVCRPCDEPRLFPPPGLPAVLSSVDDVARVCEAAGFVPAVEDPTFWKDEHDVLVDVVGEYGEDGGLDEVGVQRADDSDVATVHAGAPGWLLWSAIQAARGGEHRG